MTTPAKTNDRQLVRKFILAFVAIVAGVYLGALAVQPHHHVPWLAVILMVVILAVVGYFLLRKKE